MKPVIFDNLGDGCSAPIFTVFTGGAIGVIGRSMEVGGGLKAKAVLFTPPPQTHLQTPLQTPATPHFEQSEQKLVYAHSFVILKPEGVRRTPINKVRSDNFSLLIQSNQRVWKGSLMRKRMLPRHSKLWLANLPFGRSGHQD